MPRRSNSTPRLIWPDTTRRTMLRTARTSTIPTTAHTRGASALRSPPFSTSSITRPVRYGKVMEHAISPAAPAAVIATLPRYGPRKRRSRSRTAKVIHW